MYKIGSLNESEAKQYIGWNRSFTLENENIDIKLKNYVENFRFTTIVNNEYNTLID